MSLLMCSQYKRAVETQIDKSPAWIATSLFEQHTHKLLAVSTHYMYV